MTAPTSDALASALPAGIRYDVSDDPDLGLDVRAIAAFQAERLAEAGYVLVHTAPDEATVERLAEAAHAEDCGCSSLPRKTRYHLMAKAVLAVLADTSAQARHVADDGTGGA